METLKLGIALALYLKYGGKIENISTDLLSYCGGKSEILEKQKKSKIFSLVESERTNQNGEKLFEISYIDGKTLYVHSSFIFIRDVEFVLNEKYIK